MTGEIVIKCNQEQGHEGLSVCTDLQAVNLMDKFQIMTALIQGLRLPKPMLRIWCDMYCGGLLDGMYRKETIYDNSDKSTSRQEERPQAFQDLDQLFSDLFGGDF